MGMETGETDDAGDRRRLFRRKEDKKLEVQTSPRYYRDVMIMLTLMAVLGFFAFSVIKFDNLAEKITKSNNQLAEQADDLKASQDALKLVAEDVIKANVNGCVGQNQIRTILRKDKRFQIQQSHKTDYSIFFPGVDPVALHKAIHEQNQALQLQIRRDLTGRHCHQEYPQP